MSLTNDQRRQVGQTFDEVKQIIGEPSRGAEILGRRHGAWANTERSIRVNWALDQGRRLTADNQE